MLILARRAGEAVHIGPDVRITVLEIDGRTARIGIEAPGVITILRAELADRLASQNRESVASPDGVERLGLAPVHPAKPSRRRSSASEGTKSR